VVFFCPFAVNPRLVLLMPLKKIQTIFRLDVQAHEYYKHESQKHSHSESPTVSTLNVKDDFYNITRGM
jgi:hypothetical protein